MPNEYDHMDSCGCVPCVTSAWRMSQVGSVGAVETVVVVNDHQVPYHDERAHQAVLQYVADVQPDMIVHLGDLFDFPGLSMKFMRARAQKGRVLEDISVGARILADLHGAAKSARMVLVEGNHEDRLRKYVTERAEELEELTDEGGVLSLASLINLPYVEVIGPYGEAFIHKSFVFKHGESTTTGAAAGELRVEGSSGMSGHTHRLQVAAQTNRSGAHAWYSNMCLCNVSGKDMPPGVVTGSNRLRNQQQGFATIYFGASTFNVYQSVIIDGSFIGPTGKEYRG